MNYDLEHISQLVNGKLVLSDAPSKIAHLLTDSRKLVFPAETLFFAIATARRDGHEFITTLFGKGVRNFVVNEMPGPGSAPANLPGANFIVVQDPVTALQQLARAHRHRFGIPVIAITGSNGKTIVKEWLNQLLEPDYLIVRSPASYNSQIGVPMSIWLMNENHQLGIFEAGISEAGEMDNLQQIIDPAIGIFTNIGEAHSEGFTSIEQKIKEKLILFRDAGLIIYRNDNVTVNELMKQAAGPAVKLFTWGASETCDLQIESVIKTKHQARVNCIWKSKQVNFIIPFADDAAVENAVHCFSTLLNMGIDTDVIIQRIRNLSPVAMRLELKSGINNSSVINDSYSSDLSSLRIALDFLSQQNQHGKRTVIISDILQSGRNSNELYKEVAGLLQQHGVNRLIGIGNIIQANSDAFATNTELEAIFFQSVDQFRKSFSKLQFRDETILIKGARVFQLEGIDSLLQQKVHQTVLETDLNAVVHNLNEYRKILPAGTKIMAMVKAFSYGSGSFEIANVLQFHKVNYLAVAYADEGVALRNGGITLPIMVMNTDAAGFDTLVQYNLEPDLYSAVIFEQFSEYLLQHDIRNYPVHLEMETGMNRLGFAESELPAVVAALKEPAQGLFRIRSIYSHLAASEDPAFDDFTRQQLESFSRMAGAIQQVLNYPVLKHITNSSGTSRYKGFGLDMVRIGIGLYGIDPGMERIADLHEVSTLKTTVAQIKNLKAGDTVGYGRRGKLTADTVVATVRIGYADGYARKLGNGLGHMLINGRRAPVLGTISMDMTMLDISGIPGVSVGDEVIVFGSGLSVRELAKWADTIPYEILTSISQRVKRVYFES